MSLKTRFNKQISTKESILALVGFIHVCFAAIFIFVFCVLQGIRNKLEYYVELYQKLVGNDFMYKEIYERELANNAARFKVRFAILNILGIVITIATIAIPFAFGVFALQPLSPIRITIVEVLEIHPRVELTYLPLMLFISYLVFQVSDAAFLFIYLALMFLTSTEFWMNQFRPMSLSEVSIGNNNKNIMIRCRIGGNVKIESLFHFYKHYQIITNAFNNTYCFIGVSIHHCSALLMLVSALYLSIRYPEIIYLPGAGQLVPSGIVLLCILEYCEAVFIEGVYQSSADFLIQLKHLTTTHKWSDIPIP
ncbi:unnamed protein product [Orchesella dallaii]|uniref:Odorant receptor n=1 Tax=Orchesella dallaii TaxID=48710 RepID=A0ABP1RHQ2_9HEXA